MPITKKQESEIHETLGEFGLSEAERNAYLALLAGGTMTATPLAQAMGIPQTTAQSLLKRLDQHGIVDVTRRKSRTAYAAKPPAVFRSVLEQRLRHVMDVIPLLKELQPEGVARASINVYSRERVADIFNLALGAKDGMVYEIVSARELQKVMGERFHFTRRRVQRGVRLQSLRVEANEIKKYDKAVHERELREAKFLPKELSFPCSFLFWDDDMCAFFMPPNEGLSWTVRSKALNMTLRQIFALLWNVSRKMETLVA